MNRGAARVDVALSARIPHAARVWDDAAALGRSLAARHPGIERCRVTVHGDRRAGLRWRLGRDSELSLHWSLVAHPDEVLAVLTGDEGAWRRLQRELPSPPPPRLRTAGEIHDLALALDEAVAHLPEAVPEVALTWGRFGGRPARTLRLGSCTPSDPPLIRIHPVLDHASVPGWFVSFVVFHELLHVVFPPERAGGRRILHTDALRTAERAHPDHDRANALERACVADWLRRCRER